MKHISFILVILFLLIGCQTKKDVSALAERSLHGKWIRVGHSGVMSLKIDVNGTFELDMGRNGTIDVSGNCFFYGDTIRFEDKSGIICPDEGIYKLYSADHYIAFDLLKDDCGGRIKATMGFWVKHDFEKHMKDLEKEIENNYDVELLLSRARMNMALGKSPQARKDLAAYIKKGTPDDRVYINLAGTCFPNDLENAIQACNKAIQLNPEAKNAYFLRGLAKYMVGKEKEACDDFGTAIALGFSVLKIAEHERCAEYWP